MCNQNRKRNYCTQSPSACYCGTAGVNVDTKVKPKWTDGHSLNAEQAGVVTKTVSLLICVWIISLPLPVILLIHSSLSFYKSDYLSVMLALCWPRRKCIFYHKFLNELFTLQLKCASVQPLQAACANFEPAWWLLPSTVRPIMFRPSTGLQRSISRGQEPGLQVSLQGADGDDVRIGSVEQCCHEPCSFLDLENCYDWASHCT